MSKLIRRTKKNFGAALLVALQLTALTVLSLISFVGGPQQQSPKAPAELGVSAALSQAQAVQAPMTSTAHDALRASAVYANKVYGTRATQIFSLATSRAQSARQSAQQSEAPNDGPTLTTNQEDYPPYSYVYMTGSGFQP